MYAMKCMFDVNKKEKLKYNSSEKYNCQKKKILDLCLGWIVFQKLNSWGGCWNKNVLVEKIKKLISGGTSIRHQRVLANYSIALADIPNRPNCSGQTNECHHYV